MEGDVFGGSGDDYMDFLSFLAKKTRFFKFKKIIGIDKTMFDHICCTYIVLICL